jgi:hypothetical protein
MKGFIYVSISLILISCSSPEILKQKIGNKNFESALNEYYEYLDSITNRQGSYVIVNAEQLNGSLVISIHFGGGSYNFFHENVVDFLSYKNYDVLLIGDFPNKIINIIKTKKSNIENIVKKRYPDDYRNYLLDKSSVGPLMYDYMKMILVFKNNKMISCERVYY